MDPILDRLTDFAATLRFADLPANAVTAGKERMLDALGCALSAFDCETAAIGRSLAGAAARPELAGRILGEHTEAAADAAAVINSCMIRDLDFNDT